MSTLTEYAFILELINFIISISSIKANAEYK